METPLCRCTKDEIGSHVYTTKAQEKLNVQGDQYGLIILQIDSKDFDVKSTLKLEDDYSACEQTCKLQGFSLGKLNIDIQNDRTIQTSSMLEQFQARICRMKNNFTNYSRKRGHSLLGDKTMYINASHCKETIVTEEQSILSSLISGVLRILGISGYAEELEYSKKRRIDDNNSKLKDFRNKLEVEIDFENSENKCTKNPGHAGFIPVKELNTSHFPKEYRDQDLVETVKILGDLTVKVIVFVSEEVLTASGKIIDIKQNLQNIECPCSDCRDSKKPRKTWWEIEVLTATHIVKEDAKTSKCRLFYDANDSSLVNVEGFRVVNSTQNSDTCRLICITCNEALSNRITGMLDKFSELYEKVFDKFWNVRNPEKLVVIVSHPHGGPKKVTIGKSGKRKEISDGQSVLTYSTDTCPGSAGAFLYIL